MAVLARRKAFIVVFTLVATLLVFGVVLGTKVLPPTHPLNKLPDFYRPAVDVILQDTSGSASSLNAVLSQQGLGSVATFLGASVGAGQSSELAQFLLASDVVKDTIAERFSFVEHYGLQGVAFPKTAIRSKIASALEYEYKSGPGVLTISYKDTDRAFATEVLNGVVDVLEEEFKSITLARVNDKLNDLNGRLEGAEADLNDAKQALIDFSVKYGIIDIDAQASEVATQVGTLTSQLLAKELERNSLISGGRSQQDPSVVRLQNDIDEIKRLLVETKQGYHAYTPVTTPRAEFPRVASEYAGLKFEVTLRQALYATLRQSRESVLLDQKDQSSRFQVLRRAEVPEQKAGPSRGKICVIGAVAAFLVAVFLAFVGEYLDRARRDPEESRKLAEIRRLMRLRK